MRTVNQLSDAEIDTVLASLRLWKQFIVAEAGQLSPDATERLLLSDIAAERGGRLLTAEEIDAICDKINV